MSHHQPGEARPHGRVRDWPRSSFHRDLRRGIFPGDWAGDVAAVGEFGEAP